MSLDGNVCCAPDKGVRDATGGPPGSPRVLRLTRSAVGCVLVTLICTSPLLAQAPGNVDTASVDATTSFFTGPPRALGRHPGGDVGSLAFAPGSGRLVGVAEGKAVVWDLATGQVVAEVDDLGDAVRFGADSDSRLLSAPGRGLREVELGAPPRTSWLERLVGQSQVSLDDTGRRALWWRFDGSVWFWDRDTGRLDELLRTSDVSWGRDAALGAGGSQLRVDDGELVVETSGRPDPLRLRPGRDVPDVFATTEDGTRLALPSASGQDARRVELWDLATGAPLPTLGDGLGLVQSLAFDDAGQRLAVAHGKRVELWVHQADTAAAVEVFEHGHPVTSVAILDAHDALLIGDDTGSLWVWPLSGDGPARELAAPSMCDAVACRVEAINVDADEDAVVASLGRKRFAVWSLETGALESTFSLDITRVALSGDGSRAFLVSSEGGVVALDVESRALFSVLEPDRGQVSRVWPSMDGEYVLLGFGGETYGLYQVRGGFEVAMIEPGMTLDPRNVAFAPGSRALAWSRADGGVDALDPSTGLSLFSVPSNFGNYTRGLAFSPDGALLAVARGSLRVLDAVSGDLLVDLGDAGDERGANAVQFAPDGRYVAWANADGEVFVGELAEPAAPAGLAADPVAGPLPGQIAPGDGGCACTVRRSSPLPTGALATLAMLGLVGILRRRSRESRTGS